MRVSASNSRACHSTIFFFTGSTLIGRSIMHAASDNGASRISPEPPCVWSPRQLQCNGPNDENNAVSFRGCFPHNDHKPSPRAAGPARTHVRPDPLRIMSCNWPCWRKSAADCTAKQMDSRLGGSPGADDCDLAAPSFGGISDPSDDRLGFGSECGRW